MEYIRAAALAYHGTSSAELKQMASNFFKSLDHDGDDKVKAGDLVEFLKAGGYKTAQPSFFNELGKDEHALLDFDEVVVVYYVIKTGWPSCQECGAFLAGLYFTCVQCFDKGDCTYDLCTACYSQGGKTCTHKQHTVFMDNHALLLTKSNAFQKNASAPTYLPSYTGQLSHGDIKAKHDALMQKVDSEMFQQEVPAVTGDNNTIGSNNDNRRTSICHLM